ncbi:hypothetical protein [Halobacterium hubeiense]|uniref:hypothetical protein n=1 Tax=Halobacterium hubeiense TaxID=1407499 RepID=UPI000B7F4AC8|nr:hypothetical protein [Halobacterium hubeiense]
MTDDTSSFEIAEEAPTDEEGHPVHPDPDKDHRICAATKSDRTTPTEHGRERDDVEYCLLAAGWGVDDVKEGPCRKHTGAIDNRGENNENFEHGAFSKYFTSHLTDTEQDAFDDAREMLDEPEDAQEVAKTAASICLIKFRRSGDERFLRRFESICDKFGIAPADELELSGSVGIEEAWKTSAQDDDEVTDS